MDSCKLRWSLHASSVALQRLRLIDILRELSFDLAIDLVEVLVCKSIRAPVLSELDWVSLEHSLELFDAIKDFLLPVFCWHHR